MTPTELDRLSELANIGAGHAATAFAGLAGRTMWMRVPRVRALGDELPRAAASSGGGVTGVFFDVEGAVGALVGILFQTAECESVVRRLLGDRSGPLDPETVKSVLTEVGNILASHVASAIADTLGDRLVPSVPSLAMGDADRQLPERAARRAGEHPVRIECELTDGMGELGGLLVVVPDRAVA